MADTDNLTFDNLALAIQQVHSQSAVQAIKAVNVSLTMRNWIIGMYISEYELDGSDRAEYGERLFSELSNKLKLLNVAGTGRRQLYNYLAFYRTYPEIVQTASAQFSEWVPEKYVLAEKVRTASAQLAISPKKIIDNLSYSHLELLVSMADSLKRAFYETECIRGNWSVRELKRQITSLYYERSGLSEK